MSGSTPVPLRQHRCAHCTMRVVGICKCDQRGVCGCSAASLMLVIKACLVGERPGFASQLNAHFANGTLWGPDGTRPARAWNKRLCRL